MGVFYGDTRIKHPICHVLCHSTRFIFSRAPRWDGSRAGVLSVGCLSPQAPSPQPSGAWAAEGPICPHPHPSHCLGAGGWGSMWFFWACQQAPSLGHPPPPSYPYPPHPHCAPNLPSLHSSPGGGAPGPRHACQPLGSDVFCFCGVWGGSVFAHFCSLASQTLRSLKNVPIVPRGGALRRLEKMKTFL